VTTVAPTDLSQSDVVAIVVNYRTPELIRPCLESLQAERRSLPRLRAVVVDGGSGDGSPERIARTIAEMAAGDWVTLQPLPINGGFGYANNQGMLALEAEGRLPEAIMLLNPDAALLPGALAALLGRMAQNPRIAAVGAQLENEAGERVRSDFEFPSALEEFLWAARTGILRKLLGRPERTTFPDTARRVDSVTGAAMLLRRQALAEVGLFNDHFFLYFEETELCHRFAGAGWDVWTEPQARVRHLGAKATGLFEGGTGLTQRRLPRYWFVSWRRYFVLTGGRGRALAMGLAWTAGYLIRLLRRPFSSKPAGPPKLGRDFWRIGLGPPRSRMLPPPALSDPVGLTPGWMRLGEK
jgi:N-acetylglucosaminyl-diphospho-decaprenol L-rhamnosyltransferase